MTIDRLTRTIGLVGSRSFEMQAWRSPGARAVEAAVWEPSGAMPDREAPRKPLSVRFDNAVRAVLGYLRRA